MKALKIFLNTNYEFNISGFSRSTSIQDGRTVSNAYIGLKDPTYQEIEQLRGLAAYSIATLVITADNEEIYRQEGLTARITSIEESVGDEGQMRTYCNITF